MLCELFADSRIQLVSSTMKHGLIVPYIVNIFQGLFSDDVRCVDLNCYIFVAKTDI